MLLIENIADCTICRVFWDDLKDFIYYGKKNEAGRRTHFWN